MQDTPPSSVPPATVATPSSEPPQGAPSSWFGRFVRNLPDKLLGWPRGRLPVPTVTSLLVVAVLVVAIVELLPKGLSDVTLTVRARTEVLELELQPERTYVWWLPAGRYSLLTAEGGAGCERHDRFDLTCVYDQPTAVTIKNGGTVRFEAATADGPTAADGPSAAQFSLSLTPRETSTFEIHAGDNSQPVATRELVAFKSQAVAHWRIPLIVERVQIGEFLSESIAAQDALGMTVRQPIMIEGDVRMFARSLGREERYQIQDERFDPADVVQIPADADRRGLLLGLLSLDRADDSHAFDVTLHTDLAEVFVRRLGAEHRIGVSTWSILSNLPLWLALWVVLASLIVVANYHAARLGQIRGPNNETQSS